MRILAPVALAIVTSACFATRNDVRILQGDIFALRTQQARADSARARQIADLAASLNTTLGVVRDSLDDVGARLTSFQGATRQELYSLGQQLLQLGELMGQSQAAMARFRADLEERQRVVMEEMIRAAAPQVPPTAPPPAGAAARDTTTRPPQVTLPVPTEGPNTLYEVGRDQALRGAWAAAREAFTAVLDRFETSDRAPLAQAGIADAFAAEGRTTEADSAYRLVFTKWPLSEAAPTAMYKLGLSLDRQGRRADARALMQRLTREYPRSDSYRLAIDWLDRNP